MQHASWEATDACYQPQSPGKPAAGVGRVGKVAPGVGGDEGSSIEQREPDHVATLQA